MNRLCNFPADAAEITSSSRIKTSFNLVITLCFLLFPTILWANPVEVKFIQSGLVNVSSIDQSIQVNLVNSDPDKNFFRENYYQNLNRAYLRKPIAIQLQNAQKLLKKKHPGFSLQILDAARPRAVSRAMYQKMKGTKFERYVANPNKGSMHNYGIAVDLTIVDEGGEELDMGLSPFNKSTVEIYWQFAKMKLGMKLTEKQKINRQLLADVMLAAGFYPLSHEWWHFNGMKKDEARRLYTIIE